jgi:hypothetical protein
LQILYKSILTSSLVLLGSTVPASASKLLMCGGPQVVEADVSYSSGQAILKETWHWRPEQSKGLPVPMMRKFITTDDCKSVSRGTEVLITSSGDAVALVSYRTGETLFYATVKNAHSAELLPGGFVAVAASDNAAGGGDHIALFDRGRSDKVIQSVPLTAAHGVVWDAKRNILWALGETQLLRLKLKNDSSAPRLEIDKRIDLPGPIGHDLQISKNCDVLWVTTTKAVFSVDPDKLSFVPFAPFHNLSGIKSLSIDEGTGQIAYTQADPGVWWTYTLRFKTPDEQIDLGSMIYKVRWSSSGEGNR